MKTFKIYKITRNNGEIQLYKQLKEFYIDYIAKSNDKRSYDNFKYAINNNLYDTNKTYKLMGIEYNYKMDIGNLEIFNYKEFLQKYLNEYQASRYSTIKDNGYTNSSIFYNKIYNLAKYRVEIKVADTQLKLADL